MSRLRRLVADVILDPAVTWVGGTCLFIRLVLPAAEHLIDWLLP